MIAYKVVRVEDGRMWSVWAGGSFSPGIKCEYVRGHKRAFPRGAPGMAYRTSAAAAEQASRDWGARTSVLRCEVEPAPWDDPAPLQASSEEVWCSSITPICVVNEDGTEEGAEHRVVVRVEPWNGGPRGRTLEWGQGTREFQVVTDTAAEAILGTSEPGTEIEVHSRVLSRPEPEPERVKLIIQVCTHARYRFACPKCEWRTRSEYDTSKVRWPKCPGCGVLFEEVHDA